MEEWTLIEVPRRENEEANLLAKMESASPMNITRYIPIEFISRPSIKDAGVLLVIVPNKPTWKDDIIMYLLEGKLPKDKVEARRLRCKVAAYTLIEEQLYEKGYSMSYLRYLNKDKALYMLWEVHEGVYGNHTVGRSLTHKIIHQRVFLVEC